MHSRKFYLSLVGVLAWSSTAAETVLTILDAMSLSPAQGALFDVTVTSSTFNALSLGCIGLYVHQGLWQRDGLKSRQAQARILQGVAVCSSGAALIVSLVQIILIKLKGPGSLETSRGPVANWSAHVLGQIITWAFSFISQVILYTLPIWHRKPPQVQAVTVSGPRDSVMSETHASQLPKNIFLMEIPNQVSPVAAALPSPTFSSRSSHSLKSFRESLRHVVRPATSRTTLISRSSFRGDARSIYSQTESVDNISHSDGFENWDTSSVSLHARDVVLSSAPSKGTTLDPIPGSRPTTPARALEGPFLTELPEEEEDLTPPPKLMPDVSRPPSPAVSEAHIHPLFRSESPVPPPEATPGTSIIASPLSNQAIACPARPFNRMRSSSLLSQNQRATRGRARSPQTPSRSPSPPSRELTPPIPDYILNSSPRSSISGSRRVQLQYSP